MRDAKGAQIYEGTNQIHREIVAGEVLKRAGGRAERYSVGFCQRAISLPSGSRTTT